IGNHEAEPVAMHAETADHHVPVRRSFGQSVAIGVHLDELAASDKPLEFLRQLAARVAMQPKFTDELLKASRVLRLAFDFLQNHGVGQHGSGSRLSGAGLWGEIYAIEMDAC